MKLVLRRMLDKLFLLGVVRTAVELATSVLPISVEETTEGSISMELEARLEVLDGRSQAEAVSSEEH